MSQSQVDHSNFETWCKSASVTELYASNLAAKCPDPLSDAFLDWFEVWLRNNRGIWRITNVRAMNYGVAAQIDDGGESSKVEIIVFCSAVGPMASLSVGAIMITSRNARKHAEILYYAANLVDQLNAIISGK